MDPVTVAQVAAAISSRLRSRPEYSSGLNARLYELAIRQVALRFRVQVF